MLDRDILQQVSLRDHLVAIHGSGVKPLLIQLGVEIGLLDRLPHPMTVKDAFVQHMAWQQNPDIEKLGRTFDLGGYTPVRYFRDVLTETPGLEELARDFEKTLVEAAKADPKNRALQTARLAWILD